MQFRLVESVKDTVTRAQVKEFNKVVQPYCGWKLPQEVRELWGKLYDMGIEFMISGAPQSVSESGTKSWTVSYTYNGEPIRNSSFVYQVYEGNGDTLKNEYNMYFS